MDIEQFKRRQDLWIECFDKLGQTPPPMRYRSMAQEIAEMEAALAAGKAPEWWAVIRQERRSGNCVD